MVESAELQPRPGQPVPQFIAELRWQNLHEVARQVVSVPHIRIFGEDNYKRHPRTEEMFKAAQSVETSPTHFVLAVPQSYQTILDDYMQGTGPMDGIILQARSNLRIPDLHLIKYAKDNGIKVVAADMDVEEMEEQNPGKTRTAKNFYPNDPDKAVQLLSVMMFAERSHSIARKIREILSTDSNAEVWVNCGVLHVADTLQSALEIKDRELIQEDPFQADLFP